MTVRKPELTDALRNRVGLTLVQASRAVDCMVDVMAEALMRGDAVHLHEFGALSVKTLPGGVAFSPLTSVDEGTPYGPSPVVRFKMSLTLRRRLRLAFAEREENL